MKKNKCITLLAPIAVMIGLFTGCGQAVAENEQGQAKENGKEAATENTEDAKTSKDEEKISIVCTSFPQYDWTRQLVAGLEDRFEVTYLMDSGVDLHSYQASAEDIAKIKESDLFIYVGGESDGWVKGVLEQTENKNQIAINMVERLGDKIKEEEVVEGMRGEEEEEEEEATQEEQGPEYDEHVWTSLKNATLLTIKIADGLEKIAPNEAEAIKVNCVRPEAA